MTRTFVLAPIAAVAARHLRPGASTRSGPAAKRSRPGLRSADVDAASRQVIADAGYADNFGHGLGHGVGLQIHEAPGINGAAAGTLLAGSAVTVEPGVYSARPWRRPHRGHAGRRATRRPELLTRFPKELVIL